MARLIYDVYWYDGDSDKCVYTYTKSKYKQNAACIPIVYTRGTRIYNV